MDNLGQKVVGDSSLQDLAVGDIVSIGRPGAPQATQEPEPPVQRNQQQQFNFDDLGMNGGRQAPAEPIDEPLPDSQNGQASDAVPPAQTPPAAAQPPTSDPWSEVFTRIKEKKGIEFQSQDQFLSELDQFNAFKTDPFGFLPAEIKAHAEFLQAGGNTNEFYRLKSIDFNTLPTKEVLFQSYLRDNPQYAKDPAFARQHFDRMFKNNFSILATPKKSVDDFDNENDPQTAYQEYIAEYDYASKAIEFEGSAAREKLVAWQSAATSPQKVPGTSLTQEDAEKMRVQHLQAVNQIKTSYVGEDLPISDNPEENLKIGINDSIKAQWENDLLNPVQFFNDIGLMPDRKLDLEKMSRASFIIRNFKNIGKVANKLILENEARKTVTGRQINPRTIEGANPQGPFGDDEMAEVADAIRRQHQQRRAAR